jgi:hypothetical protein
MSLLLNASPWTSTSDISKKRIPTIKKTFKTPFLENNLNKEDEQITPPINKQSPQNHQTSSPQQNIEGYSLYGNNTSQYNNTLAEPTSIDQHIMVQETKNNKINQLLENMSVQNVGDSLYNYNSSTTTELNSFNEIDTINRTIPIIQRNNEIIGNGIVGTTDTNTIRGRGGGIPSNYESNIPDNLANLVNYSKAYEIPNESRPYYTQKMGISNSNDSFEEKILDKIQYLTHLMEEIQSEKTANITEEFVLYTMLGVFVIYVVDAFSKSGKYIR